jgi:hypothetical protein
MIKKLHDVELMLECFKGGGLLLVLLDGDQSALLVLSKFDSK